MAEYLSPAVYIEEMPSGIRPIEGVSTSIGAFVGITERGPVGEAVPINNFAAFIKNFGGYIETGCLAYAVKAFFDEGGKTCYVVRVCHYDYTGNRKPLAVPSTRTHESITVTACSPGSWGDHISIEIKHGTATNAADPNHFQLFVKYKGADVEEYRSLLMDSTKGDYAEKVINGISKHIVITAAGDRPAAETFSLSGGNDGLFDNNGSSIIVNRDFLGDAVLGNGLLAFDKVDGVNILAIPDATGRAIHIGGMTYCENRGDCFYVADSQREINTADEVLNYKHAQGEYAGGSAINSKYGALYTPWIYVSDPMTGGRRRIPPSGAVAGKYANTDSRRGVHKAPAGLVDGKLGTALDVDFEFVTADQEKLNPRGINVIRKIKGVGNVVWGARTVSSDPEWRYLNVRRLFLFLEESIEKSIKWAVFEPNDPSLWKSIARNVSAFLRIQWRQGALVGNTEEEAFYVKCDEETNPQEIIDAGRVITEIGVAPSKPAEFVIFRIAQWDGGSEVEE